MAALSNVRRAHLRLPPQQPEWSQEVAQGLVSGKTDGQDAYVVYDGGRVLLARSIRRTGQPWGLSLATALPSVTRLNLEAWIIPTKRLATALPASESLIPLEAAVLTDEEYAKGLGGGKGRKRATPNALE